MAGITTERQGEMLRVVFEILLEHPDGLPAAQVLAAMRDKVGFNEYENGSYKSTPTQPRGYVATRFWTTNCVKAGWLVKDHGTWSVTATGRLAFETHVDPGDFARQSEREFKLWKKGQVAVAPEREPSDNAPADDDPPTATATATLEQAEEAAWAEIAQHLQDINPYEFQKLVASLLEAMDYHISWNAPPGPDQGIDIIATTDPLGAEGPRIKVQVKRHQTKVAVDGIRSFMAVLGANDIGVFVNTGGFTSDAQREARNQETRRITLLDAQQLFDLWVLHYEELPEQARQRLPLRPVQFLAPPE